MRSELDLCLIFHILDISIVIDVCVMLHPDLSYCLTRLSDSANTFIIDLYAHEDVSSYLRP